MNQEIIKRFEKMLLEHKLGIRFNHNIKKQNTDLLFEYFVKNNKLTRDCEFIKDDQLYYEASLEVNKISIYVGYIIEAWPEFVDPKQLKRYADIVIENAQRVDIRMVDDLFIEEQLSQLIKKHYYKRDRQWFHNIIKSRETKNKH